MKVRIHRNRNYTVMSNHHLLDSNLSLKAKGLLSLMLALPETWKYNRKGLQALNSDGQTSIESAMRELIKAKYVLRYRERNSDGTLGKAIYDIHESPMLDFQTLDKQTQDTATLLYNNKIRIDKSKDKNVHFKNERKATDIDLGCDDVTEIEI